MTNFIVLEARHPWKVLTIGALLKTQTYTEPDPLPSFVSPNSLQVSQEILD